MIGPNGLVNIGSNPDNLNEKLNVEGVVRSEGWRCRQGRSGPYGGNVFNYHWTGSAVECWVDSTQVGLVNLLSDRRLKEKIIPMKSTALERVMALKPVAFNYRKVEGTVFSGSTDTQEGFIADEGGRT